MRTDEELQATCEAAKALPLEELKAIAYAGAMCGTCSECKADSKNSGFDVTCSVAVYAAWTEILRRKEEETPKPESEPVAHQSADMLSFGRTIQFMRDRGHKRCYMCGSSLTGGGDNGS